MSRPSRAASELTIFILGFFAVWALRATYGYAIDDSIASPGARTVYATAVKFALWVVPAIAFARWIRREPPIGYLGITPMPTARQWAWRLGHAALRRPGGLEALPEIVARLGRTVDADLRPELG